MIVQDIAAYLEEENYGVYANVNPTLNSIFLDEFQDAPANQIVLFLGGGRPPSEVMGGAAVDYPSLDIQVRNSSKSEARRISEEIRLLLDCKEVEGAGIYDELSAPVYLGKDSSNRHRFVISFSIIFERV